MKTKLAKQAASNIRNLESVICSGEELQALRDENPALAVIAEKQNKLIESQISYLRNLWLN